MQAALTNKLNIEIQKVVRAELKLRTAGLQVQCADHLPTLSQQNTFFTTCCSNRYKF